MGVTNRSRLENFLRGLKTGENISEAQLRSAMLSVEPKECASAVKSNNCLGTVFHALASSGNTKLFACIMGQLKKNATDQELYDLLKSRTDGGETALHKATYHGHTEFVKLLLEVVSGELRFKLMIIEDASGNTPLHHAMGRNFPEIAAHILNSMPQKHAVLLNFKDKNGLTPRECIKDQQAFDFVLQQHGIKLTTGCLQTTVQSLVNERHEWQRQNRESAKVVGKLSHTVNDQKSSLMLMQRQVTDLQEQCNRQSEESQELRRKLSTLETELEKSREGSTLETELEKSREDGRRQLQEQHSAFNSQLQAMQEQLQAMQEQLQAMQKQQEKERVAGEDLLERMELRFQEEVEKVKVTSATKAELEKLSQEVTKLKRASPIPPEQLPKLEEIERRLNELQSKENELELCVLDLKKLISDLQEDLNKVKLLSKENEDKLISTREPSCSQSPRDVCCPEID